MIDARSNLTYATMTTALQVALLFLSFVAVSAGRTTLISLCVSLSPIIYLILPLAPLVAQFKSGHPVYGTKTMLLCTVVSVICWSATLYMSPLVVGEQLSALSAFHTAAFVATTNGYRFPLNALSETVTLLNSLAFSLFLAILLYSITAPGVGKRNGATSND